MLRTRRSAGIRRTIWRRCSRRSSAGWTASRCGTGITAIAGAAPRRVYNPFDVLLPLRRREFEVHWFETGTPAFLVDTLFERRVSSVSLGDMVSTGELLSAFDVGGRAAAEHIGTEALLFQTGYLTITGEERLGGEALFRLGYPNREVRQSLNEHLLRHLVQDAAQQTANSIRLARLLEAHDRAGLKELFHAFFASIPYQRYAARRCRRTNNHIADYEGFYASVFYSYFAALGYEIAVEKSSSHGRLDMAVRTAGHVYLFEFKVAEMAPPGAALAQLQERGYADKYRAPASSTTKTSHRAASTGRVSIVRQASRRRLTAAPGRAPCGCPPGRCGPFPVPGPARGRARSCGRPRRAGPGSTARPPCWRGPGRCRG